MAILARKKGSGRRMLADINVVPYIDVMLVLVVILMVSAPFVNPSLVDLPSVGASSASQQKTQPIFITVKKDGSLMVRDGINDKAKAADRPAIVALATSKQRNDPNTPVVIEGDRGVQYEKITEVMNALYTAKIKRVGLAVKPAN